VSGHPLAAVARLDGVADAVERVRAACTELRWHPGLRRGWPAARTEAGVRCAAAGLVLDGLRVPLDQVRAVAVGAPGVVPGGPVAAATAGAVRVQALVVQGWAAPGAPSAPVPLGQLLAQLHVAAVGGEPDVHGRGDGTRTAVGRPGTAGRLRTAAQPTDLLGLGAAPVAPVLGARLAGLGAAVGARGEVPGLVVAAVALAELLVLRPFDRANGPVARAVFRRLLTSTGVDPVGVVVPEVAWVAAPNVHLAAAAAAEVAGADGMAAWVGHCADAVLAGVDEGRAVADAVAAGRLDG
jgi:hypothetical protein